MFEYNSDQDGANLFKKNTESNITNQIFSFLSRKNKSSHLLEQITRQYGIFSEELMVNYYTYMEIIKQQKRKYLNRKFLLDLTKSNNPYLIHLNKHAEFTNILSLANFARLVRVLIHYHLRKLCPLSIISSKKIDSRTFKRHLERRR